MDTKSLNKVMSKKILFIAPDFYGFNDVIYSGLKQYSGCHVTNIVSAYTKRYEYKHYGERLKNLFLKTFCNINIKDVRQKKDFYEILCNNISYDQVIINRPDVISDEHLLVLKSKTKVMKVIFWDSLAKIEAQSPKIKFFDKCFSFDKRDCDTYGFIEQLNFYFHEGKKSIPEKFDVLFWGTEDGRINHLIKILNYLNTRSLKARAILYNPNAKYEHPHSKSDYINVTNLSIPFSESYKINLSTKIILDLAHQNQTGLSFRPFDAMGLGKKLITTNENILNYDFYKPENILYIDPDNIDIPNEFLAAPYQEIDQTIKEKYSLENWIKNLLAK